MDKNLQSGFESFGVPYIVYESEMARHEKRHRRLIFIILILIGAIVVMNLAWLYAWMQYDYSSYEASSLRGNANIIGQDGDIYNGNGEIQDEDQEE